MRRVHIRNFGLRPGDGGWIGVGGDGICCRLWSVDVFDDDAARGLVPDAVVVNQGAGADGVEYIFGVGSDAFGVAGNVGAGDAHVSHAALVEAGGASVAVNGAAIGEIVLGGDFGARPPVEKVVFNFVAVFVVADGAPAGVAGLIGTGLFGTGLFGDGRSGRDDVRLGGLARRGAIWNFGDCEWCELCAHFCFLFLGYC